MSRKSAADSQLFSAYAEVFPQSGKKGRKGASFLCLRRGVSIFHIRPPYPIIFSLPTQRCFRLPGFLWELGCTFLCLRRGVSNQTKISGFIRAFSLPTQRCFHDRHRVPSNHTLFSAYAEVFLIGRHKAGDVEAFLCLRRGVSGIFSTRFKSSCFSLPTQRCFC